MPISWDVVIPAAIGGGIFGLLSRVAELYANRNKARAEAKKDTVETEGTAAAQWQAIAADVRSSDDKRKAENELLREKLQDLQRRFDALQIIVMDLLAGIEVTNREIVKLGGTVWTPHVSDEMILMAIGGRGDVLIDALRSRLSQIENEPRKGE